MTQILNRADLVVILNGHRFVGWAAEERPWQWPDPEDMYELETGADAGLYGMANTMLGGICTARLSPSGPTTRWCVQQRQYWRNAVRMRTRHRQYNGIALDAVQGRSARITGGVLMQCPDLPEPGVTFEAQFRFELIDSNVDGATFTAPFASA